MSTIAVSFCNQPEDRGGILALLDEQSGERRWLDCGNAALRSGVGLATANGMLYCAASDGDASYLAIFDAAGDRRDLLRLESLADIHSIRVDGDDLIAVSTGTDQVVRVALDGSAPPETIWAASQSGTDTHHLNALARMGGSLVVSGFGPRQEASWSTALDGYIYDIEASRYVKRGLLHPHSVAFHNGIVVFCESSRESVRTLEGELYLVDGYARGLAFGADGTLYAGSSIGRRATKASALVLNPADAGGAYGRCTLTAFAQQGTRTVDLVDFGNEIYDVLFLGL